MPRLGAHLSAAGGVSRAAEAAVELGCDALQVFLRPPGRWAAPPLDEAEIGAFRRRSPGVVSFAHAPYLLNPASADPVLRERSIAVLAQELQRAGRLGLAGVVLHPGSAGTDSEVRAEARCAGSLADALRRAGPGASALLLEGTAGAGALLGRSPTSLRRIAEAAQVVEAPTIGICLDTAHLWAAGYDLESAEWGGLFEELETAWGVSAPSLLHINDTPVGRGSRRDRHAPPGEGVLGEAFFRRLLGESRLVETPMVMEVPPGKRNELVREALERLRAWTV